GEDGHFLAVQDNGVPRDGGVDGPWVVRLTANDTLDGWTGTPLTDLVLAPYTEFEAIARWRGALVVSTDGDRVDGASPLRAHVVSVAPGRAPTVAVELPAAMQVPSYN